jgi:protein involved in sex pheromone biosynthesis
MKRRLILGTLLLALIFLLSGCYSQLGETKAEGSRRHARNIKTYKSELSTDIDKILLLDEPSKLSERRMP